MKKIILIIMSMLLLMSCSSEIKEEKKEEVTEKENSAMVTPDNPVSKTFFYLGTVIDIKIFEGPDLLDSIEDKILSYDNLFNRKVETSDTYILNEKGTHKVHKDTLKLIETSVKYSKMSDGYFDITINPIVNLWNIGTDNPRRPSDNEIESALKSVDYKNISINNDVVTLNNSATIDLGGIAKGFIADDIAEFKRKQGVKKAIINLGGNVYVIGNSPKEKPWNIGVKDPFNGDVLLKVMGEDMSVVTSGVYERFFEENGKLYHHIFNPFTGYPMDNEFLSLTVVSPHSIDGDALSTALFNLGPEKAFELAKEADLYIIGITKDKKILISNRLFDITEIFDDSYKVIIK